MLNLTPDEFSYKLFTAPKTQITTEDLCNALLIYKNHWTKKDLKLAIKKVGLTGPIKQRLKTHTNPLTSYFNNTNDEAEYIVLRSRDLDPKYMIPEEYQRLQFYDATISNINTVKQTKSRLLIATLNIHLSILKRYPRTTQSRILIKYLKQTLKDN